MSLSMTLYRLLSTCTGSTQEDLSRHDWKIVDWDGIKQTNKALLLDLLLTLCLIVSAADYIWKQFGPRSGLTECLLIWIQMVWHSDGILERFFQKRLILKKIIRQQKSMQTYPVGRVIWNRSNLDRCLCLYIKICFIIILNEWRTTHYIVFVESVL